MKVYNYHPKTGEYLSTADADPDPLQKGRHLVPAHATEIAPPPSLAGMAAVFDPRAQTWSQVIDLRGTFYYDENGREHVIEDIGETVPDGFSLEPRPSQGHALVDGDWVPQPPSREDVLAERDRRLRAAATVIVSEYGDIPVQLREKDAVSYLVIKDVARDLAARGVSDPMVTFRDAENTMHSLTPEQVLELIGKAQSAALRIYSASWQMLDDPDGIPSDYAADARWS